MHDPRGTGVHATSQSSTATTEADQTCTSGVIVRKKVSSGRSPDNCQTTDQGLMYTEHEWKRKKIFPMHERQTKTANVLVSQAFEKRSDHLTQRDLHVFPWLIEIDLDH